MGLRLKAGTPGPLTLASSCERSCGTGSALAVLMLLACGAGDGERSVPREFEYRRPAVLPLEPALPRERAVSSAAGLLPEWCARVVEGEQEQALGAVAVSYYTAQERSCAALTARMSPSQKLDWQNYLSQYSQVLAGCHTLVAPPVGGIRAFGLANTSAVGAERVALGRADVALLVSQYVPLFVAVLTLDAAEQALLESQLWSSAERELGSAPETQLSACARPTDAGG